MSSSTRTHSGSKTRKWIGLGAGVGLGTIIATAVVTSVAGAQPMPRLLPDLSGSYACEGDEIACEWSGEKFTIVQTGATLKIRSEKGDVGLAKLTSPTSLSAGPIWNMLGVIVTADSRTIQWSNGTIWRKLAVG